MMHNAYFLSLRVDDAYQLASIVSQYPKNALSEDGKKKFAKMEKECIIMGVVNNEHQNCLEMLQKL